jgi:hypothetical protein
MRGKKEQHRVSLCAAYAKMVQSYADIGAFYVEFSAF